MNINNFETVFFAKQEKLFTALERFKKLYNKYLNDLTNLDGKTWEEKHNFDFNLLHDLEYRLKDRITDLQSIYYDFHFEKYQFNAY